MVNVILIISRNQEAFSKSRAPSLVYGVGAGKMCLDEERRQKGSGLERRNKPELMSGNISKCKVVALRTRCVRKYLPKRRVRRSRGLERISLKFSFSIFKTRKG
jgi:hypothetical protein